MNNHPMDGATAVEIKADPEQVRVLVDPFDKESKSRSIACVSIASVLESGLGDWLDANVREQKMSSRIARNIVSTLTQEPEKMHPLNRGLTILAKSCRYDSQRRVLTVGLVDPRKHGIIDGGHTFRAIANVNEKRKDDDVLPNAYVNVEVLVGYDEIGPDIISARNSVCQVRDSAIYALEGVFDEIKKVLQHASMLNCVSFKQNEGSDEKPVSIEEVIAISTLFHPNYADGSIHPMRAYTSRAGCVEAYAEEWKQAKEKQAPDSWNKGFGKILPLIPDILRLAEEVEIEAHEAFRKSGGLTGLLSQEEESNAEREGREKGRKIKEFAIGRDLPFTHKRTMHSWPSGYLYPLVGSLRPVVDYSGEKAKWKVKNPFLIFQECSPLQVKTLFAYADRFGRKPNAVGKNDLCWQALYNNIGLHVYKKNPA